MSKCPYRHNICRNSYENITQNNIALLSSSKVPSLMHSSRVFHKLPRGDQPTALHRAKCLPLGSLGSTRQYKVYRQALMT